MTSKQSIVNSLESIAQSLEQITRLLQQQQPKQEAPNYKALLEEFLDYDWGKINATLETTDSYGAATIIWQGDRYKRRSPQNKYGTVIFFSRCIGNDAQGNKAYDRLITFAPIDNLSVEPISNKADLFLQKQKAEKRWPSAVSESR